MRLVCPNCDAKYEVPEDAIPETGRDVQCANCGHAWFQMRPRAAETVAATASAPAPAPVPVPPAPVPPAPEPVAEVAATAPAPAEAAPTEPVPTEPVPNEPAPVEPEPAPLAETSPEPVIEVAPVSEATPPDAPVPDEAAVPAEPDAVEPAMEVAADTSAPVEEVADADLSVEAPVEAAVEAPVADETAPAPEAVAEPITAAAEDPVVETDATTEAQDDLAEDPVDAPASTGAIAAAGVAAYAVDDSVLAILREEAEREAQARKAEAAKPLETQTDLGLEAAIPASRRGQVDAQSDLVSGDESPDDRLTARRTRLPDVEEINSTLRPSEVTEADADSAPMAPAADGRSSFRSGFLLVMTLAILTSALYGSADAIASAIPALEGPLRGFVAFIDSLRLQLDGLMQSATVAINGN